jgi:xylulokinase
MPVEIIEAEEGAAYGAALLAGVGAGVWSSVDQACDSAVKVAERVEPDQDRAAQMNRQYATYRKLYPALREIFREL